MFKLGSEGLSEEPDKFNFYLTGQGEDVVCIKPLFCAPELMNSILHKCKINRGKTTDIWQLMFIHLISTLIHTVFNKRKIRFSISLNHNGVGITL